MVETENSNLSLVLSFRTGADQKRVFKPGLTLNVNRPHFDEPPPMNRLNIRNSSG
jgi:hypothetical protein